MPKTKAKQWSQKYDECKTCGTKKLPHKSRGLCSSCYAKESRRETAAIRKGTAKKAVAAIASRPLEWTPERVAVEAQALLEWSNDESNLVLEKFGLYRKPPYIRSVMYKLGELHEDFRVSMMIAKERLRSRREEGAVVGTYNSATFQFTHGFMDHDENDKEISFTKYKDERKKVDDTADVNKQKQALEQSKAFVDEAKDNIAAKIAKREKKPVKKK